MKTLKIKLLGKTSALLAVILSWLGFGFQSCGGYVCDYGVPTADFEIKGTVTDETNQQPIENIRIIVKLDNYPNDTLTSNAQGEYVIKRDGDMPVSNATLTAQDVDGEANGLFEEQTKNIKLEYVDDKKAGNWYLGKATAIVNFVMKPKK